MTSGPTIYRALSETGMCGVHSLSMWFPEITTFLYVGCLSKQKSRLCGLGRLQRFFEITRASNLPPINVVNNDFLPLLAT